MEIVMKATRESFGEALLELGKENDKIVVLDADLASSTKTNLFAKEFPKRFFEFHDKSSFFMLERVHNIACVIKVQ